MNRLTIGRANTKIARTTNNIINTNIFLILKILLRLSRKSITIAVGLLKNCR